MGHREASGNKETGKTTVHGTTGGGEVDGAEETTRVGEEASTATTEMEVMSWNTLSPPMLLS